MKHLNFHALRGATLSSLILGTVGIGIWLSCLNGCRPEPKAEAPISYHRPETDKDIRTDAQKRLTHVDSNANAERTLPEGGVLPLTNQEKETLEQYLGYICHQDINCPLYLRCIQETCQVPPAITGVSTKETPTITFHPDPSAQDHDGQDRGAEDDSIENDGLQSRQYYLELAQKPSERQRGLMFRRSMKSNWGMLFDFGQDGPRSFWMKNTYLPLDMIFINATEVVVGVVTASPLTTTSRQVGEDSRYVLELNAGEAKKWHIKKGTRVKIQYPEQ